MKGEVSAEPLKMSLGHQMAGDFWALLPKPCDFQLFSTMSVSDFQQTDSQILKTIEWHSRVVLDKPDLSDPTAECPQLDVSTLSIYYVPC